MIVDHDVPEHHQHQHEEEGERDEGILLSRYEVAKIVSLRAVQLDQGADPFVEGFPPHYSSVHIATRELYQRKLDVLVCRSGTYHPAKTARYPMDLEVLMRVLDEPA